MTQLIIYCDESIDRGRHFSNFYGGVLIQAKDREALETRLHTAKADLRLGSEVKWTKTTANYAEKYKSFVDAVFDEMAAGHMKMRVMFTQNRNVPVGLSRAQHDNRYFLLYFQFIKHAFGLQHHDAGDKQTNVALYLDDIPDTDERLMRFRDYLSRLGSRPPLSEAGVSFSAQDIANVRSHDHVVLQALDIVLGAMQFRLNDLHKEKPEGSVRRGRRTLAKAAVYRHILRRIQALHPGFNIGISTGRPNGPADTWSMPYRHWLFVPAEHEVDESFDKIR